MDTIEMLIFTRSLERIVAALMGGAVIYMAFKLFLHLPNLKDVDDNFRFRKYLSFHILKIGMGTVFMMFGGFIILSSLYKGISYEDRIIKGEGQNKEERSAKYSGIGDQKNIPAPAELIDTKPFPGFFSTLNTIPTHLNSEIAVRERRSIDLTISRVKLNLMLAVWEDDAWGDRIAFRNWVIAGAIQMPPPMGVSMEAINYFKQTE